MQRLVGILLCAWLVVGWVPVATAAPESPAVTAVAVTLGVERTLLEEDVQHHADVVQRRSAAIDAVQRAYQALDAAVPARDSSERLLPLLAQVEQAESDRASLLVAERVLIERLAERRRRIVLLEQELATLQGRQDQEVAGKLSGTWDLVLMPLEHRGSCVLQQSGTLITGTYELEGGWSGSLQGTLVNRKVLLTRIDSKLGKIMELEGFLSSDDKMIRGTWLNYELAGADGSRGQWVARRRPPKAVEP